MHGKVQQRFSFVKSEGSLKYAIPAVDRGRGHRYQILLNLMHFLFARTEKRDWICTYALDIL